MPLTDVAIRNAKPTDKAFKLSDARGLYLLIKPNGSKLWQMKYTWQGKERALSFGPYPHTSLSDARKQRDQAKLDIKNAIDPSAKKKVAKAAAAIAAKNTFADVAKDYLRRLKSEKNVSEPTMKRAKWLLNDLAGPSLSTRPISEIKPVEILSLLQKIERSGRLDTARRLRATLSSVFKLAIVTLRADSDPTAPLIGATAAPAVVPRPAITDELAFGRMLKVIDEYDGWPTLTAALRIIALLTPRPQELRLSTWKQSEFDLAQKKWSIPEERMKSRRPHDIPLSRQAVEILSELKLLTGDDDYVFSSIRNKARPLSENALNSALRRMGIAGTEHCAHGFRSSFSTIAHEAKLGRSEVVEMHLAHLDENETRRIYNRAKYWDERIQLMQDWADYCDDLKAKA